MQCKNETGCAGELNMESPVNLQVGCSSWRQAFPCNTCGRIHWPDGTLVNNRQGHRAFLEDGSVVNRDANGAEMSRL